MGRRSQRAISVSTIARRRSPGAMRTRMTSFPATARKSLLIQYVARQVPDLEMPPTGKGDPLTPQQISLLRAWIDQDASWKTTNQPPALQMVVAPTFRWFDVSGNKSQFRALEGVKEGFSGE